MIILSNLDEELLSVLIDLQNAELNTHHEISNSIVKSQMKDLFKAYFGLKWFLMSVKECLQRLG